MAAAAVLALSLIVALGGLTLDAPSAAALAEACRGFALPELTVSSVASLALGSLAVSVLILAVRSTVRQVLASRRVLRGLPGCSSGPGGALIFEDLRPRAFCAGLLCPHIYLSSGAVQTLAGAELEAVLAHEAHHARLRDPLRVLIARVLGDALFFLPALRRLAERYAALAELAADSAAVEARGRRPLASALLTFEAADPAVVGIAPERVDHLLGDRPAWELPLALVAWTLVVLTAIGVIALRLDAAEASPMSLPMLAGDLCMVAMAVVPVVVGGAAVLAARRALDRSGRT